MASNTDEIYILDTNILYNATVYNYLKTYQADSEEFAKIRKKGLQSLKFISDHKDKIRILDAVWTEFLGVYLQKNIDYSNYAVWYNKKFSAINKTFRDLMVNGVSFVSIKERKSYLSLYTTTQDLTQTPLDSGLVKMLNKNSGQRIIRLKNDLASAEENNNTEKINEINETLRRVTNGAAFKVFDGIDGVIAAYSVIYAKQNKTKQIILITDDNNLRIAVSHYHKIYKMLNDTFKWPENCDAKPIWKFRNNTPLPETPKKLRRLEKKQYN